MKNKNTVQDEERSFNRKLEPFIYLIPHAIGLLTFVVYPIVNTFIMAVKQGYKMNGKFNGYGLSNFEHVFADPAFANALKNTFIYAFTVVPIATALSIIIAVLLNRKIKGMAFFQTAFFLPMVTSAIAIGCSWRYMFDTNSGVINYVLKLLGGKGIDWLGAASGLGANLAAVIIFGIWYMIPMTTILILSGLQNIDPLYYTAAQVDGASGSKQFFRITLPLLTPTIFLTLIINIISAFKVYKEVVPFWNGEAGYTTHNLYTLVFYIKAQFYTYNKFGYAAAASVALFGIVLCLTLLQRLIEKKMRY